MECSGTGESSGTESRLPDGGGEPEHLLFFHRRIVVGEFPALGLLIYRAVSFERQLADFGQEVNQPKDNVQGHQATMVRLVGFQWDWGQLGGVALCQQLRGDFMTICPNSILSSLL